METGAEIIISKEMIEKSNIAIQAIKPILNIIPEIVLMFNAPIFLIELLKYVFIVSISSLLNSLFGKIRAFTLSTYK